MLFLVVVVCVVDAAPELIFLLLCFSGRYFACSRQLFHSFFYLPVGDHPRGLLSLGSSSSSSSSNKELASFSDVASLGPGVNHPQLPADQQLMSDLMGLELMEQQQQNICSYVRVERLDCELFCSRGGLLVKM